MLRNEFIDRIETYYVYRRASEPLATGGDEERYRMRILAERALQNLWHDLEQGVGLRRKK